VLTGGVLVTGDRRPERQSAPVLVLATLRDSIPVPSRRGDDRHELRPAPGRRAILREMVAMRLSVMPKWVRMSYPWVTTGDEYSTNVLACQVLGVAGDVAGWHLDATKAEIFCARRGWSGAGGLAKAVGGTGGTGGGGAGKGSRAERVVPFPGVLSRVLAWRMKPTAARSLGVGSCV
jgi:hypothetical protein